MTTQLPNGYEAVKVPKNSCEYLFNYWPDLKMGAIYYDIEGDQYGGPTLPGNYSLVGRADELTEEQCGCIVEGIYSAYEGRRKYKDYQVWFDFFSTALESFRSLLASLHLEPHTTIILKKENV